MAKSRERATIVPDAQQKRRMRTAHGLKRGAVVVQNLEGGPKLRGPVNKPHIRAR